MGIRYTINHDVNKLEQHHDDGHNSDGYTPHANATYYINEEAKPRQAKIIANIDDILGVIRDMPKQEDSKEKQALTLIRREDNLTDLLYQFAGGRLLSGRELRVWPDHSSQDGV